MGLVAPELTKIPYEVFRAYDIRGVVEDQLTESFAYYLGKALGSEIVESGRKNIAVGFDGRHSSPILHRSACLGLRSSGVNVFDVGLCSSPMLYYACHNSEASSGLMITGSHNPPEYNGMKMLIDKQTLTSESIKNLSKRLESSLYANGAGEHQNLPIKSDYIKAISDRINLKKPLRVVIDCGHGVGALVAEEVFLALGCEVIPLYCSVDGDFPAHHPDPSIAENLVDLQNKVIQTNADIGLAFDGDADRLGVVDSNGKILWPDRQMMLFSEYFLKHYPGDNVVFDVKCSKNLAAFIESKGGRPVMWKTGHSLIKAKMHELSAQFSGEMSGHLFFGKPWFGFDDGVYAGALLCQLLSEQEQSSAVWFSRLPDSISTPEIKVNISEDIKFKFMTDLLKRSDFAGANINKIDGLRVEYPFGWGLVRASNTTPCLTLRFEANDADSMLKLQGIFKKEMLEIKQDLELGF